MNYNLFIDNFRGFSDARIPISHVNFLVGQNSTGKTSVMGLLKLFSGPGFLFQDEFGDSQVNFGQFSDMVSAHSEDRSCFRVGLVWEERGAKKGRKTTIGWLGTFVEDAGLPRLSRYTFCRGAEEISLRFAGANIYFKTDTHPRVPSVEDILSDSIPRWANEHRRESRGYEKLHTPRGFPRRIPVMMALSLIGGIRKSTPKRNKSRAEVHFVFPSPDVPYLPEMTWIAPIRTKPSRTYDELTLAFSPEGGHTPYLIRRLLRSGPDAARFRAFIERVGIASGLFQDVRIRNFGRGATAPFEVDIVLDGKALNVSTVGYGVSQSLPVLVEILARQHGAWFAIQQPEVHLHPRAQAALGDVFFEMAATEHKLFMVETHSDFTIDRFRMNYRTERPDKPDSQILFFERRERRNIVTPLPIGKVGDLPTDQPEAYRDFFVKEEFRLLGI